jgi:hypothetical protein
LQARPKQDGETEPGGPVLLTEHGLEGAGEETTLAEPKCDLSSESLGLPSLVSGEDMASRHCCHYHYGCHCIMRHQHGGLREKGQNSLVP